MLKPRAFGNTLPGLRVAAQCAGDDGVKQHILLLEIRTQTLSLLVTKFAQVVVVFCAKRCLAVTD